MNNVQNFFAFFDIYRMIITGRIGSHEELFWLRFPDFVEDELRGIRAVEGEEQNGSLQ